MFKRENCAILYEIKYTARACDGIGRHAGFRFPCFQRVGSSPFRRTKTPRWLLTGHRGVLYFIRYICRSIRRDRRLLLDRHGVDALLQHPPDERVRALDSIKGRDQIHARGAAADMHHGPKLRTQAFRQLIAGVAYHEKIRRFQWAAIGIEPVGVVVLTVMSGGLMWLFLAALSLSTYNILQRKLTQKYSAMQASTCSIFFGTILLAIFSPAAFRELAAAPAV